MSYTLDLSKLTKADCPNGLFRKAAALLYDAVTIHQGKMPDKVTINSWQRLVMMNGLGRAPWLTWRGITLEQV